MFTLPGHVCAFISQVSQVWPGLDFVLLFCLQAELYSWQAAVRSGHTLVLPIPEKSLHLFSALFLAASASFGQQEHLCSHVFIYYSFPVQIHRFCIAHRNNCLS